MKRAIQAFAYGTAMSRPCFGTPQPISQAGGVITLRISRFDTDGQRHRQSNPALVTPARQIPPNSCIKLQHARRTNSRRTFRLSRLAAPSLVTTSSRRGQA